MTLWHELIGGVAAACTTFSFVPQALKVLRTRHTQDLSLGMYATFAVGIALWLCYGILIGKWPIILANAVTLGLVLAILGMKIKYG